MNPKLKNLITFILISYIGAMLIYSSAIAFSNVINIMYYQNPMSMYEGYYVSMTDAIIWLAIMIANVVLYLYMIVLVNQLDINELRKKVKK